MQLIDGKKIAERIKDEVAHEVFELGEERPNLAIILVGEREDSKIYVDLKERQAKSVGIDTHIYKCDTDIKEESLLSMVDFLNEDTLIDAILIQLPLPKGIDTDKIVSRMKPEKDVDGFHPENLKKLLSSCNNEMEPPLIGVIFETLSEINFSLQDKKVVALVNWKMLGDVIKHELECRGAKVEIVHDDDLLLKEKTKQADVLVVAIGKEKFITAEMLKQDAVVIDVGINQRADGTICGDVYMEDVSETAGYLTPVPGGVGPMTIAVALKNTLYLHKKRHSK